MPVTRAFICGCAGTALTAAEKSFLAETDPFGLILFKRNIDSASQVRALVDEFRALTGRDGAAVLIDQEGGRVQRLGPPNWRAYPAAARLGKFAQQSPEEGERLIRRAAQLIARDLRDLGINIDCMPVLDVPIAGSHDVIGDRAYAFDKSLVARFGRAAAEGLLAGGVLPVMKHIPGHGRAMADSHLALPVVTAMQAELEAEDFAPFKANADLPAAMTAHVVYTALDSDQPGTISKTIIQEIIRGQLGFNGLLISDDLSMKALSGTFREKTEALFAAGVDLALHCNGDLGEASEVAAASPEIGGLTAARIAVAFARLPDCPEDIDPVDAWAEIEAALAIAV
jgi:beta-N-acetylhexosaminidase